MKLIPIVEGHGDYEAVPVLLRRLAVVAEARTEILRPIRIPKSKLVKEAELRKAVQLAGKRTHPGDAILVLVDADEDCPARLGPTMLAWAKSERADRRIAVVLANREFEAWFLAATESLVAAQKFAAGTVTPADAEAIADAKGRLSRAMGRHYSETIDQPALAALFDLETASRCRSFAKLRRDFAALVAPGPRPPADRGPAPI